MLRRAGTLITAAFILINCQDKLLNYFYLWLWGGKH
jgi:hypothetical protein